jgi:hypothetical protein
MVNGIEFVAGVAKLSVTVTAKVNEPVAVGVPESEPSEASVRPVGNAPDVTVQLKGGEPPLATLNTWPA